MDVGNYKLWKYTTVKTDNTGGTIQTSFPGIIEGASRVFTVETKFPFEGNAHTRVYHNERAGTFNPDHDIRYFRMSTPNPTAAYVLHLAAIGELARIVEYSPTDAFESHCTSKKYNDTE